MIQKNKNDLVILFSGGADSVLLVELAKKIKLNPYCIMIDYEQKHIEELNVGKRYLEREYIPYNIITVSGLEINSALTGNCEKGKYENVSIWNVPFRNTIFLSIAAGIAENLGIKEIWIGCDMSDYYGKFPDCYQSYIAEINSLFKIAGAYPIEVNAPLLGFTKDMVISMLNSFAISEKEYFSGYGE